MKPHDSQRKWTLWSRHWAQRPMTPSPHEGHLNAVVAFPRRRVPQEEQVSVILAAIIWSGSGCCAPNEGPPLKGWGARATRGTESGARARALGRRGGTNAKGEASAKDALA